jgi:hypothetical protein
VAGGGQGGGSDRELPRIDFSTFILSLSTSALYQLGLVEDPQTGRKEAPDLPMASQTIDTLALLEEKTRGNLDADEEHLLQSLLYELRMRYVEAGQPGGSEPSGEG